MLFRHRPSFKQSRDTHAGWTGLKRGATVLTDGHHMEPFPLRATPLQDIQHDTRTEHPIQRRTSGQRAISPPLRISKHLHRTPLHDEPTVECNEHLAWVTGCGPNQLRVGASGDPRSTPPA